MSAKVVVETVVDEVVEKLPNRAGTLDRLDLVKKKLNKGSESVVSKALEKGVEKGNRRSVTRGAYNDAVKAFNENKRSNPGNRDYYTQNVQDRIARMNPTDDLNVADNVKKSGMANWMWNHKGATAAMGIGAAWGLSELMDEDE